MNNLALWKKTIAEATGLLVVSAAGMYLFGWARVWLISHVDMSRFANILAQLWSDVARFSPVPLDHLLTYPGRIAIGFEEFIVILIVSVWAISRGSDCVSGELGRGTMEMLLAQPVSRSQVLLTQATVTISGIGVLVLAAWLGTFTGIHTFTVLEDPPGPTLTIPFTRFEIPLPGPPREPSRVPMSEKVDARVLLPAIANLFALGFFLAGFTTLLSSWDRYRWRTIGIAVGFCVVQMVFKGFGRGSDSLEWLTYCTFYTLFEPQTAVFVLVRHPDQFWDLLMANDQGQWIDLAPLGDNLFLIGLGLIGYIAAAVVFCRRDLPAPL